MSEHIKNEFKNRVENYLQQNPPEDGQLLAARFDERALAELLADAMVELADDDTVELLLDDDRNEIPARSSENGVRLFIVHVLTDVPSSREPTQVTQGFATGLRNHIQDESLVERNGAAMFIFHRSANLDTLEAANFLTRSGEILDPDRIREELLDPSSCDDGAGEAVIRAVRTFIDQELGAAADSSLLSEIAQIRSAIDDENVDDLATGIGNLPGMIPYDGLKPTYFGRNIDGEGTASEILSELVKTLKHAETLKEAFAAGKNTREVLQATYNRDFVDEHAEKRDWSGITYVEAEKGTRDIAEPDPDGNGSDESDDGDDDTADGESDGDDDESDGDGDDSAFVIEGDGSDGTEDDEDTWEPEFENYQISTADCTSIGPVQGPFTRADERHVVRCENTEDPITVELNFSTSLDGGPTVVYSDNETDDSDVEGSKVTFTVDPGSDDEIRWRRFELYIDTDSRRGYPDLQLDLALVPEWWQQTLGDTQLNIDRSDTPQFVLENPESISLTPPRPFEREVSTPSITEDEQRVTVEGSSTLYVRTPPTSNPPSQRMFYLDPPEAPGAETDVSVPILAYEEDPGISTLSVRLPLALEAIMDPNTWADDSLKLSSPRMENGTIQAAGRDFVPRDSRLKAMVEIEKEFIEDGTPAPRKSTGDSLSSGTISDEELNLPDGLERAYDQLFDYFQEHETTPSIDSWGSEAVNLAQAVVNRYKATASESLDSGTYNDLHRLGILSRQHGMQSWMTPFHPLMLAYAVRLAEWRDSRLAGDGLTAGFKHTNLASYLTPSGLLPYMSQGADDDPLWATPISGQSLWTSYVPIESYDAETPDFMRSVVKEKVVEFCETFERLFQIHPDRPLTINFINTGGLRSGLNGLMEAFADLEGEDTRCPPMELRIYGAGNQGLALDRFFTKAERDQFGPDWDDTDQVEQFKSRLTFTRRQLEDDVEDAHLTFFRGILQPGFVTLDMHELPDRLLREGLMPQESERVDVAGGARRYLRAFSSGQTTSRPIHQAARYANQIEWGHQNLTTYGSESKLGRSITADRGNLLNSVLDYSTWAIHVQPPVGLEFYTDPEGSEDGLEPLVIHYDDTKQASPGYDIITTTTREELYIDALEESLRSIDQDEMVEPEVVLDILAAIEGGSVTELRRASSQRITELIGLAGTLVLSRSILRHYLPSYSWIAVNLADEVEVDRARRNPRPGTLPFVSGQRASDDLMFVGVPERLDDESSLEIKLWFAEAKGGTASVSDGVGQVKSTVEQMKEKFDPSEPFADTEILRSAVGRLILDSSARLQNYSLLTEDEAETLNSHEDLLLNGDFTVSFLEDINGCSGEAVNVGGSEISTEIDRDEGIRTIEVPVDVFGLLGEVELDEQFTTYDVDSELGFNRD